MTWVDDGDERLERLLRTTPGSVAEGRGAEIETLLTDGYAHVLELDAELQRRRKAGASGEAVEQIIRRRVVLRDLLDEAKRRFGASWQRDLDRRSPAGGGPHDESPT